MSLAITLDVPKEIEMKLRSEGESLNTVAREALALELYRQERLDFYELSQMLGLDKIQTSELLQRHKIYIGSITMEDLEEQQRMMEEVMGKVKPE